MVLCDLTGLCVELLGILISTLIESDRCRRNEIVCHTYICGAEGVSIGFENTLGQPSDFGRLSPAPDDDCQTSEVVAETRAVWIFFLRLGNCVPENLFRVREATFILSFRYLP